MEKEKENFKIEAHLPDWISKGQRDEVDAILKAAGENCLKVLGVSGGLLHRLEYDR